MRLYTTCKKPLCSVSASADLNLERLHSTTSTLPLADGCTPEADFLVRATHAITNCLACPYAASRAEL